jgi:hypothetical protein
VVLSLDDDADYMALSYEWNPPELGNDPVIPTKIDGHRLYLTANLCLALLFITRGAPTTKFWVDALCINQDDNEERARQAVMMTQIFEKAPSVVAWLGSETDDSNLAMDLLSKFQKLYDFQVKYRPADSISRHIRNGYRSNLRIRPTLGTGKRCVVCVNVHTGAVVGSYRSWWSLTLYILTYFADLDCWNHKNKVVIVCAA